MELLMQFLPAIVLIGTLYFFMIKPQQKAAAQKRDMISALAKGDVVVTIGGLHGVIDEVNQANKTVVLDCEGIYLTFELAAIASVKAQSSTIVDTEIETISENEDNA